MGYTRTQLSLCEGATIPDLIGEDCRLLFVGINPGLQTAMTGIHFAHPSNRFWPALAKAGLLDWVPQVSPIAPAVRTGVRNRLRTPTQAHCRQRLYPFCLGIAGLADRIQDADSGLTETQREDFVARGMGITNLVDRATARASELGREELRVGGERLGRLVAVTRPRVVAIAGITAYRDAFGDRAANLGPQPSDIHGSELWVVPNPSGLNAHETVASLAEWYRQAASAAGLS